MSGTVVKRGRFGGAQKGPNFAAYYKKKASIPVAPTVKKYVKRCMNKLIDDKFKDTNVSYTNIPNTGAVFADTLLITQGLTGSTRVGNLIRVKQFTIYGIWSCDVVDFGRVIVAWDRQSNGAAPAVADILTSASSISLYNTTTVVGHGGSRFEILSDTRRMLEPNVVTTADLLPYSFTWKGDKVIRYDGVSGTITDLVSNNLVVLYISNGGSVDFFSTLRVKYQDA